MLESVVADLLNKFLGSYVENLDRSQLKLGIWGGNVSLENLRIRENALSELDVPFKVKAGLIEKLTLKIPWKNLYGDAVVATLEGLYLLVVPGASINYDAEKEERNLQEAKQRELQRIEEALQKAAEKDKPKEEKKDTLLEKLAAQVIKNLQVKITNIHIRYEDDISDANLPVSVGITLAELSLQTANELWVPCILNEATKIIHKLVRLDSFSTYWNVNSNMYYHHSVETILTDLKSSVMSSRGNSIDYQYIFKPVSASAKLYINPNAEIELQTPKLDWDMEVQHVAIELTKPQYLSMIDLLASVDYMVRNVPYRKYRPVVTLKEDCRKWWNYAITSILEVRIKQRTHMWTWSNIVQHRENLKAYKNVYKVKLTQTKVPEETLKDLQALENKLDVFNIILARQQAQAEVVRSGQKVLAKKSAQSGEKKSGGWFGGFWGRKDTSSKKEDSDDLSVPEKIDDLMTPEEKKKLFTAIGYSESSCNLKLPKAYVAHILGFKLLSTSITIREDAHAPETLKIQIIDLSTRVFQRPGAQALKVVAKLDHWYVTGLKQQNIVPSLVSSIGSSESSLLKIQFETNPENSTADQVLILQSQPVEIIYDAVTINALADFFQTHKGMDLEQLTSATLMKLEEIKEKTAAGLTHMIETRKVLDLRINLQPSFLLLPKSGFYHDKTDVVIVDFGSLQLNSINQGSHSTAGTSSLEELMDKAYDKFHVQIKKVQMLFGTSGEDWKKARAMNSSSLHILQPLDIDMQLGKAMVERDSRMPRFKVSGELPLLRLKISDRKLQGVFELVNSIPLPQKQPVTPSTKEKRIVAVPILSRRPEKLLKLEIEKSLPMDSSDSDEEFFDTKDADPSFQISKPVTKGPSGKNGAEPAAETTPEELADLHLKFEVKEVILELTKQQQKEENTVLVFSIQQLGTEACIKTYDLQAVSYLKTIKLDYYDVRGLRKQPLHLINSSDIEGLDLLKVEYIKADKNGPKFQTTFENTEQTLKVAFSSMELLLHSQALLSAISFITEAMPSIADKTEPASAQKQQDKETFVKKATKTSKDKNLIAFKVFAKLNSFSMNVWDEDSHIAEIKILGLDSSIFLESSKIDIFARLKDIIVNDVNPQTIHKKAVCIMEEEVFNFNMTLYPDATQGEAYKDVSKVDGKVSLRVGCMKIVFLNKFLVSLLRFLNNFQAAKERVSAATAHAAHRAATSVKDLAERSFRLLMDIHLKAPVIVIPQSSVSNNALVADLGLIKVQNQFRLISSDQALAPVVDCMTISLTEFKLSRTLLNSTPDKSDIQMLYPINLSLAVNRNLAATWYHQIPALEVKGHLNSMDVCLSQEDLNVLFSVLVENLGEGGEGTTDLEQASVQIESVKSTQDVLQASLTSLKDSKESSLELGAVKSSPALNILLNFEIKKVIVQLMRQSRCSPLHIVQISQLGAETRVGSHEMTATVYLQKISMTCNDFKGSDGGPLLLINSSDDTKEHLLKMEYVKADREGPGFKAIHNNIVQRLSASMSSLDLILHTQALLSLLNFLSAAMPSGEASVAERTKELKSSLARQKSISTKPEITVPGSTEEDVFDMKLSATLNAFNVFVCDETCNIADIRIQGMDASYAVQASRKDLYARLRDFVVINVDPKTIHHKAVYILGEEVFSLQMTLFPDATEGPAYKDMTAVDGKILLRVGCIHIVCLYKFLMSLLNFFNTFQAAKEAVGTATAQAAEKAASSMKDLAQKSFRLAMDIDLKAPVIYIPQSSVSSNVIVADLGLIRVRNKFTLVPDVSGSLPPVIDKMDIQLTELKLLRTVLQNESPQPELEILQPVNLIVSVQRNLAASWYSQIPAIQIDGDLKPMQIAVSQDDLTVLMNVLFENLSEKPSLQSTAQTSGEVEGVLKETSAISKQRDDAHRTSASPQVSSDENPAIMLKFGFNFESLSVMLYNNDTSKLASEWLHHESLRLGELRLHCLSSSGMMCADSSMDFSICLKTCTLDDLREGVTRATSRMIDQKDSSSSRNMIDITYKQNGEERSISAIMEKLYVCASVEFLMTVGDFFIKAMPQAQNTEKHIHSQPKQSTVAKAKTEKEEQAAPQKLKVKALIMDPEIVFVANLTKADAPALTVSFQGNILLSDVNSKKKLTAIVKEFKVLACPFLRKLRGNNVTTVVQPCSLQLESITDETGSQDATLLVEEVVIKISPIILNTVLTIMAVLKPKPKEDVGKEDLVEHKNIWGIRTTESCNNWFLGVESADEVTECFQNTAYPNKLETFSVKVNSVQVTLECGLGHRTVPLLLVESTFTGTVKNWTSLMNVTADTTLEVHYYNEMYAVWEPLIERVDNGERRWSLKLEMNNNPVHDKSILPGDDFVMIPEPQSAINITSKDTMNISVSKCTLGVFSNLSKTFSEGTASTFDYSLKDKAPLIIINALGVPLTLQHGPNLRQFGSSTQNEVHNVNQGQSLELEFSSVEPLHRGRLSALHRQESSLFTLGIVPQGYTEVANIPVTKPARRLYNVRSPLEENCVSVVIQIDASEGNKVLFVRSPLQIKNHFSVPFTVYKFVANAKLLEPVGICKPDEEFHVPLHSYRCQLFLKPTGVLDGQFKESTSYIMWKEMLHRSSEVQCTLQCPATEINFLPFIVNCTAAPDEIDFITSNGEKDWDPAYIIHLYPSLTIRNLLPYSLRYLLEGTADGHILPEGSSCDVLHSRINGEIMELDLIKYQGRNWNGHFRVHENLREFFPVCFTAETAEVMTVDLSIHVKRVGNRMVLSVFSPYWIINKTSRILQYRAEDVHVKHPSDYRDVILFSFKKKNIFSKNKIQLCISTSSWSSGFSLDTVGSYGCVKCPGNKIEYLVGVNIKMSSFNLTRIVTLTPFYTLVNNCTLELEVGEIEADGSLPDFKWNYVGSSECVPFWPDNVSGKMCVRVIGYDGVSKPFFFNKQDNGTLLSLEKMNTGLMVDVSISDHSIVIRFSDYYEGAAPALIMNHTPRSKLTYGQSGTEDEKELHSGEARLFAWEDPTGTKKLTWKYSQAKGELDLLKDESGQFAFNQDTQIHWVSFLDGRQRILLFTEDVALVSKARQAEELEQPDQEINISIHSLGLSLINNETKQEISYIGITSSGIIWELMPKQKWKPFSQKQILQLEQAYEKHFAGKQSRWAKIDNNFEVSFNSMEMRLPVICKIRRSFLSGIHVEFKQSPHQRSLRAQLYWLQVDNQLAGSMFPAVFHPVAPPKSIALDSEPRPFIDVSIISRFNEFSKVMQFKYFMVLIQCMALKVDQGFLAAIIGLFTPATPPEVEKQRTKLIQKDLDSLNRELMESSMTDITTLSFFEHFHISPVKLHLSLSLGAGGEESNKEEREIVAISSVNLLLKSIGATLTDVDDLIFKLACFEVKYQFYKRDQLKNLVIRHYSEQFLKQLYVLVLGLDVLGNPFGLIRGLSEGVEAFFYEPFQGAVQGPEEFAEGLVIGVRSLLGHTVGGAAGVVSRITGSVGKGLAAITMDKEYQQKRREEMGRQPKDFGESLAKGGKGLLRGVVGGVTGIITKPVEGAKKEGAAGFFKGIGKGLVGVVARPTGGIIDMASSTFQGIQRVAESTEDVSPLRPPRFIHEDGIIRPYNRSEAQGLNLFENSNIKKLDGEMYRFCCPLGTNRKADLVVTNRRIMSLKEMEILGHRIIDWDISFEEFLYPPKVEDNLLTISVKDHSSSVFQKKENRSEEVQRRITVNNSATAQEVLKALDEAWTSCRQQTLVRQKSERFIKQFSN